MEPQYRNKQIVWVQQTDHLESGDIGIFYLNGNAYCKKLQDDENGLFLISLNPEYAPMKITETDELFQLDLKSLPEKGGPNEYEHLSDHSR